MNFFNKIPNIVYDGYPAKNILARAQISEQTRNNRLAYYPYTMKEEDRPDIISHHYYGDSKYLWVVWMSNDLVDPYFDVPLNTEEFNDFIIDKYGSIAKAKDTIKYYRNNWEDYTDKITPAEYNILPDSYKKYYGPVVDNYYEVMFYSRNRYDDIVTTNEMLLITLESDVDYAKDDRFQVDANHYGYVVSSTGNTVIIQHVTGNLAISDTVDGIEITDVSVLSQTIAYTDAPYWKQVSCYDYEDELNEAKKHIRLIDVRFKDTMESELKRVLTE